MTVQAQAGDRFEFDADTDFQRQARRRGGVTRAIALKNAEAAIEQVRLEHADWPGAELDAILTLVTQDSIAQPNITWIDTAMLYLKRIADVGSTLGYPLLTFVAQNLGQILAAMKNGARYHAEVMTCHLDAFRLATQDRYRQMPPDTLPELTRGLNRVLGSHLNIQTAGDDQQNGRDQKTFSISTNASSAAEAAAS